MFGRKIAEQMGWAKKLNPVEDASLIVNRYDPALSYIEGEASGILDYCRVVPAPEGNLQVTRLDRANSPAEWGVVASWLVTGSTKPETEPVFERESIACGELAAYTAVADRLFTRSSWDLMRELSRMFTGELRHLIDIAIMQGTGVNQPTGIIGYAGVDLQTRETANQVEYLDLVNLKYGINPRALAGSVWILQHDVMAYLEGTLATVDGRPLFAATVASGPVDRLLGFPYVVTVDCNAALGAEGDVVFGNFSHYTIAMEDDVVFATDDGKGAGFTSNTTYVKAYASVGGLPLEPDAFSVLDNEVSP
jgi:HK97 family phage major capsid protein